MVLSFLIGGCAEQGGGTQTVMVAMREWAVEPDLASVGAGMVRFVAVNQGAETHELVVVRADSVDDLPLDENGAFDEEAYGAENVLGEVEDVATLTEKEFTLDMESGSYLLLCNIIEEEESGEIESHFSHKMYTTFTVEP